MAETHQDLRSMNTIAYILLMILVTNAIRIIPVTLIRKRITNPFLCSFLYYVPYVTLSVMTFPAIVTATSSTLAGSLALVSGIVAAWKGWGLFPVSTLCCIVVFIVDTLMA
ncbi:MAG: AzlD domain-containing protein [Prevotella sp.]|nr:AzlD domain-containing protein [Prevotella sp.]